VFYFAQFRHAAKEGLERRGDVMTDLRVNN
jgi:hypothetical protein